jgi:hypothetical protein
MRERANRAAAAGLIAWVMIIFCPLGVRAQQPASGERAQNRATIDAAARIYDLDPVLMRSIAAVESDYDAHAVSPKGAEGLMQLMPSTARRFSVEDPFDPADNALGAVRFVSFLRQWQTVHPGIPNGLAELLAAYNAGEGAVEKYGGVPPHPETREYVRLVMIAYLFDGRLPKIFRHGAGMKAGTTPGSAGPRKASVSGTSVRHGPDPLEQLAQIKRARADALKRIAGTPVAAGTSGD